MVAKSQFPDCKRLPSRVVKTHSGSDSAKNDVERSDVLFRQWDKTPTANPTREFVTDLLIQSHHEYCVNFSMTNSFVSMHAAVGVSASALCW